LTAIPASINHHDALFFACRVTHCTPWGGVKWVTLIILQNTKPI
jgi:hypothetical protein